MVEAISRNIAKKVGEMAKKLAPNIYSGKAFAQLTVVSQIFLKLCKIDPDKLFYLCYSQTS